MPSSYSLNLVTSEKAAQFSTRVAFFIAGFCLSSWAPLVPLVRDRTGIDDAVLGLLLLCLGVGSISAMPVAGYLVGRYGCRRVIVTASLIISATLPLLACLTRVPALAVAIVAFGVGVGMIDCAMNIQAVIVNDASRQPIMSGFHGLYSLGGICGATGMIAMLGASFLPFSAVLCVSGVTLFAIMIAAPHLLPHGSKEGAAVFVVPKGKVLFLGALCFIVFITEGAMLDWSGVFLVSMRGLDSAYGGLGFAAFATTMTGVRLVGDFMIGRFGAIRVMVLGSLCASLGITISLLSPSWQLAVVGYALVGAGSANIVPILFVALSRQTDMPQGSAVPAMTTLGYAGVLIGPALIGFIANASSLEVALALVAAALLVVTATARSIRT